MISPSLWKPKYRCVKRVTFALLCFTLLLYLFEGIVFIAYSMVHTSSEDNLKEDRTGLEGYGYGKVPLSRFGLSEYQCTGNCECSSLKSEDERRNLGNLIRIPITFLTIASGTLLAQQKATEYFQDQCEESTSRLDCDPSSIKSEIETCYEITMIRLPGRAGRTVDNPHGWSCNSVHDIADTEKIIKKSKKCGCYHCGSIFDPKEIEKFWCDFSEKEYVEGEWTVFKGDEYRENENLFCPRCMIPSYIICDGWTDTQGVILSKDLLRSVNKNTWPDSDPGF